jgi:hypothetical protein
VKPLSHICFFAPVCTVASGFTLFSVGLARVL